jgi:hypothetical protein
VIARVQHGLALTAARWLMLLYVVALPIVRPLDTRLLGIHVFATDIIFAAAFAFWLASVFRRGPWFDLRYLVFAGIFFLALFISTIFSTEPRRSLLKLSGVFYLIATSIVIADLVRDLGFLRYLAYAWVAGSLLTILGTAIGLIGFFLGFDSMATNFFLFHFGSLPPGHYPRIRAFFENPNMTANYVNVAVMIVLGAWRAGWLSARLAIGLAILLGASALLAISPGLGGLILSVGLWAALTIFYDRSRVRALVLAGCVVAAVLAFLSTAVSPVVLDVERAFNIPLIEKRIEPSVRALVWQNSLERGMEFPILGRGTGTDAALLRSQVATGHNLVLRDAHQAWLNVFGQAGIVGLTAFIALCCYLFSICRFRVDEDSERSQMLAACSCAYVGAFLFQNLSGSFEDARQLWVLVGMLVGLAGAKTGVT